MHRRLADIATPSDLILPQAEIVPETKSLLIFRMVTLSWATPQWRNCVAAVQIKLILENHSGM